MRRLIAVLALFAAVGCNKPSRVRATASNGDDTNLRSIVQVGDPRSSIQLLRGFHEVEGNSWRWTKGKFAVTLRPPLNGERDGAYLMAKFSIAESTIKNLQEVTLSATINGVSIPGETYSKTGDYIYKKEVPAAALQSDAVTVEFLLDKYLAAGQLEGRELGIIVALIGLEAK